MIGLLALLSLQYPLPMLPLLLLELVSKAVWLVAYALPLWLRGPLDASTTQSAFECLAGVVLVRVATPWGDVFQNYARAAGEPWRRFPLSRVVR